MGYPIPDRFEPENAPDWAKALKLCLAVLWDGTGQRNQYQYICVCLLRTCETFPEVLTGRRLLKLTNKIEQATGNEGDSTYEDFLLNRVACSFRDLNTVKGQDGRRRWILQMIEDFGGVPDERK